MSLKSRIFNLFRPSWATSRSVYQASVVENLPADRSITLLFSAPIDKISAESAIVLKNDQQEVDITINFSGGDKTVIIFPAGTLIHNTLYTLEISNQLKGAGGESFGGQVLQFKTQQGMLEILSIKVVGEEVSPPARIIDVPLTLGIAITFSSPLDKTLAENHVSLTGPEAVEVSVGFSNDDKTITFTTSSPLTQLSKYVFMLTNNIQGAQGETFGGSAITFYTTADETPKFPLIADEELLTLVQQQTFRYFWDFAHPHSGLARERNTSGDLVTTGGSGFGLMTILVGIGRGFISRQEGVERLETMVSFLETADRFHGAWPHWMDGNTGKVIPFSPKDNGGDLVETALLVQGLLTVRAYLNLAVPGRAGTV